MKEQRMVLMIEDTIEGVPAIHAAPVDRMSHPLPTIFFFHGYRSSKELSSFFGYMLATAGFRVASGISSSAASTNCRSTGITTRPRA
jgi:fermentation-respiration switch protein FrsA (DUF1100 family)